MGMGLCLGKRCNSSFVEQPHLEKCHQRKNLTRLYERISKKKTVNHKVKTNTITPRNANDYEKSDEVVENSVSSPENDMRTKTKTTTNDQTSGASNLFEKPLNQDQDKLSASNISKLKNFTCSNNIQDSINESVSDSTKLKDDKPLNAEKSKQTSLKKANKSGRSSRNKKICIQNGQSLNGSIAPYNLNFNDNESQINLKTYNAPFISGSTYLGAKVCNHHKGIELPAGYLTTIFM